MGPSAANPPKVPPKVIVLHNLGSANNTTQAPTLSCAFYLSLLLNYFVKAPIKTGVIDLEFAHRNTSRYLHRRRLLDLPSAELSAVPMPTATIGRYDPELIDKLIALFAEDGCEQIIIDAGQIKMTESSIGRALLKHCQSLVSLLDDDPTKSNEEVLAPIATQSTRLQPGPFASGIFNYRQSAIHQPLEWVCVGRSNIFSASHNPPISAQNITQFLRMIACRFVEQVSFSPKAHNWFLDGLCVFDGPQHIPPSIITMGLQHTHQLFIGELLQLKKNEGAA